LPGEQEARRVSRKSAAGVPLEDVALADLRALAAEIRIKSEIVATGIYEGTL
jgi:LDH2 family malate/lactate/ureidoglycolate dehydrogenase